MIAGVADLAGARGAFEPLRALGYEYREHRPEAHLFVKSGYGIHLTQPASDLWRERLAFRDALRADASLRRAYAEWKLTHAADDPSFGPYTGDKRPFVKAVLERAGIALKPDEERLTPAVVRTRR